jgi:hypothetical protein
MIVALHAHAHCELNATRDASARLYKIDHLCFSVVAVQTLWKRWNAPFTVASWGTPEKMHFRLWHKCEAARYRVFGGQADIEVALGGFDK